TSIFAIVDPWTILRCRLCRSTVITCHSRQGGQNPGGSESEELPPAARRARRELADH
ncbi:unnamed protein product, partial [Scytosiphon promiscuus]